MAAVETSVGIISGRDAIYLDRVSLADSGGVLVLEGSLNAALCSRLDGSREFVPFTLTFTGVERLEMNDQDAVDWECDSSFDVLSKSPWPGGYLTKFSFFVVMTYDRAFRLSALSWNLSTSTP